MDYLYVDSISIEVCKRGRISMNKVLAGVARGKTTKDWFYGLKLHLVMNRGGGIAKASFNHGNNDDRQQLELMVKNLFGEVLGDCGYISQTLLQQFLE